MNRTGKHTATYKTTAVNETVGRDAMPTSAADLAIRKAKDAETVAGRNVGKAPVIFEDAGKRT